MKTFVTPTLALLALAASIVSADTNSTTYPGRCTTTADCKTYGAGLECIAVDSSTAGLATLNMCIASGTICSGSIAGRCPTFSSWPTAYRKVQTVCAFTVVANCDKQITVTINDGSGGDGSDDAGVTTSSPAPNTTVECYSRNFTVNGESKVVNGIYQCQDARKYIANNGGHITNLTQTQIAACGGDPKSTAPTLCNGQGTCSPKTSFAQEYECKCNSGYDGDKYCAVATSNACSNLGQCGTAGTCVLSSATIGACQCDAGAAGNQCAACDATSKSTTLCSGRGTCTATGTCSCKTGYTGTQCADTTPTTSGGTGTGTNSNSNTGSSDATSLVKTAGAALTTLVAVGVMIFA